MLENYTLRVLADTLDKLVVSADYTIGGVTRPAKIRRSIHFRDDRSEAYLPDAE